MVARREDGRIRPGRRAVSRRGALLRSALALLAALGGFSIVVGCASTQTLGARPRVEALSSLKVGESTAADVLLEIGEPTGEGSARFRPEMEPRQVWSYEYTRIRSGWGSEDVEILILLVFLHDGRYDGHLWFGGGPLQIGSR